jgi:hypothetical protein
VSHSDLFKEINEIESDVKLDEDADAKVEELK